VIDEHLTLKDMVEDRAAAGKRALGSWLGRCRREVGDVGTCWYFQKAAEFLGEIHHSVWC
jgi:hypothetical protein